MFLEPIRKQRPPSDDVSLGVRLGILAAVVVLLFSALGFRLWFLQVLSGDRYVVLADNNRTRSVPVEAPRGVIYDRNGKALVKNRAGLSVGILPMDLRNKEQVVPRLAKVLGMPEDDIWKKLKKTEADPYVVAVIKEDVPEAPVVAYLKEHSLEFPGVRVEKVYLRSYPLAKNAEVLAPHLLGYVGEISDAQLLQEPFRTLKAGDKVGKDGVELQYDGFLRGTDGSRTVEVDAFGRPKRILAENDPQPGKNLVLTVDGDVQAAAERAITQGIERARLSGFKEAAAGAVVALNPKTGEVLASASYPTYDPAQWVGGMSAKDFAALNSPESHNPLLDRVIMGRYPAGSTFKPFVAATALRQDLITPATVYDDPGTFRIGQQVWRCWKRDGHGEMDLVQAITQSCDVYFYNLGKTFYEQTGPVLQDGVSQFGFGQATGIDLPGESVGRVPDKAWKKRVGKTPADQAWRTGDDVNLAIGQGDLLVTPMQLAVAFSAVANAKPVTPTAGQAAQNDVMDVLVPRLGKEITDAAGNVIHRFDTERRRQITMRADQLGAIRTGLLGVTSDPNGTAYYAFEGFPIPVAGKTGTAEKKPEKDYAWFMGYAPANDPQILVVALLEQGGHGSSVAAPMVRQVMESYFHVPATSPIDVPVTE